PAEPGMPTGSILLTGAGDQPSPPREAAPNGDTNITIALPGLAPVPAEPTMAPAAKPAPRPERRAMPSPSDSPPIPGSEYHGYPLIGVPPDNTIWPLMQLLQGTPMNEALLANKTRVYGWVTAEGNWSTSRNSNTPDSYWIRPNKFDMDQALIRFERQPDT